MFLDPTRALSHGTRSRLRLLSLSFAGFVTASDLGVVSDLIRKLELNGRYPIQPSPAFSLFSSQTIFKMSTPAFDPSKLAKLQAARIGQSARDDLFSRARNELMDLFLLYAKLLDVILPTNLRTAHRWKGNSPTKAGQKVRSFCCRR
jgi:hypothetical protein